MFKSIQIQNNSRLSILAGVAEQFRKTVSRKGRIVFLVSLLFFSMMIYTTDAQAILGSDACRNVNFRVTNNFNFEITVDRFDLFSASEGRLLRENFRPVAVPANTRSVMVRAGEDVEYGENDRITMIVVHYWRMVDGRRVNRTWTDRTIANPICTADRTFVATVGR